MPITDLRRVHPHHGWGNVALDLSAGVAPIHPAENTVATVAALMASHEETVHTNSRRSLTGQSSVRLPPDPTGPLLQSRRHDRPPTCGRRPCSRSASADTTSTTLTPPAPGTASTAVGSTSPPRSSASSNASAGSTTCAGRLRPAWPPTGPGLDHQSSVVASIGNGVSHRAEDPQDGYPGDKADDEQNDAQDDHDLALEEQCRLPCELRRTAGGTGEWSASSLLSAVWFVAGEL